MKRVSLVLMGLVLVMAVVLPAVTVSAASVAIEVTSVTSEGCLAGDAQQISLVAEWSGGSGGWGGYEWNVRLVDGGGLLATGGIFSSNVPPAASPLLNEQFLLASDLAPGTLLQIDVAIQIDNDVALDTAYYVCGASQLISPTAGAGSDMVPMPEDATVGTFTTATPLYFAPAADAMSDYIMEPGQSLWVFGLSEAGTFYQVLLSGHTYWVPVANMGPTYDDVWNGAPLPTTVID